MSNYIDVLDKLKLFGFDVLEKDGEITLLKDSVVTTTSIKNIIDLLTPKKSEVDGKVVEFPPLSINDVIECILLIHLTEKEKK